MTSPSANAPLRSFGRRKGRVLRDGASARMERMLPELLLKVEGEVTFPQPLHLEIGFGSGEHLAARAEAEPGTQFIGCEPYINGVVNFLKSIDGKNLQNVRLWMDDVRLLLPHLPDSSVERVYILFPDPWPKARHHKRRLIQPEFLHALSRILPPGGELILATDHVDYGTHMLEVILQSQDFTWKANRHTDWQTPPAGWVRTGYQIWAESEGRQASYFCLERREG